MGADTAGSLLDPDAVCGVVGPERATDAIRQTVRDKAIVKGARAALIIPPRAPRAFSRITRGISAIKRAQRFLDILEIAIWDAPMIRFIYSDRSNSTCTGVLPPRRTAISLPVIYCPRKKACFV